MKIVIYHTTDIHGHIFPTNYVSYQNLGLLKILSFIESDKKNYNSSLLFDGGDLIQGSALTSLLSKKDIQNPITVLTQKAGYNAYTFGNHEFNYGKKYLNNSYKSISDFVLSSNIKGLDFNTKPYEIYDVNGFKIAVIAMTTSYIPNWEQDKNIEGMNFLDPVTQYGVYEKELKENSDFIVVLYHGGFEKSLDENFVPTEKITGENQGSELLEKYNSIDIILSGHQHRSFVTKIKNTVCSQPINNGKNFTKIVIDTQTNSIEYELVETENIEVPIIEEYSNIFSEINKELDEYLSKVIGKIDKDILVKDHFDVRLNGSPFINLIQKIQLDLTAADFSATTLFDSAIGFEKNITVRDVLLNYPFPNTLKVLNVSGKDIKKAIEISASYFVLDENKEVKVNEKFTKPKVRNYAYDFYYGLDYTVDLSRAFGSRVLSIKKDGKDLDLDKNYTIVLNNYRSSDINDYPCYEGKEIVKEVNIDMSELIIEYIANKKDIVVDSKINFEFIY